MAGPFVKDVATDDFEAQVIERSRQVPVLVDFWAEWCGPCRMLGPVLEKLAAEFQGAFELAKVDTEASPELATRYQIRGIPAVKLFLDGEVADEFVGALPEKAVREFLRARCPTGADKLVRQAAQLLSSGDADAAAARLREAVEQDPQHAAAHLALARIALGAGDVDEVRAHVDAIDPMADEAESAQYLRDALRFQDACRDAGGQQACRQRLDQNPDDLDARFALGACLAASGSYREALDEFLAVVAKDRRHKDEAARKAMLTVFGILGVRSDTSDEYRRKLSVYL